MLTAEFEPQKLASTQDLPEQIFGIGVMLP